MGDYLNKNDPFDSLSKDARRDAVRAAARCMLPLEKKQYDPPIEPAETGLFSHFTNRWNHRTKPVDECIEEMIKDKAIFYDRAHRPEYQNADPEGAAYDSIVRDARAAAERGKAKGQTRERWYGRY